MLALDEKPMYFMSHTGKESFDNNFTCYIHEKRELTSYRYILSRWSLLESEDCGIAMRLTKKSYHPSGLLGI